mmetsp:Transcript_61592/g.198333  ORF Transcript_61592/g.198333 Transcript_61592/m.198333 type:complete len:235 (-) Transcript_61592:204-908(-)
MDAAPEMLAGPPWAVFAALEAPWSFPAPQPARAPGLGGGGQWLEGLAGQWQAWGWGLAAPDTPVAALEAATLKEWSRRLENKVRSTSSKASTSSCASRPPSVEREPLEPAAWRRRLEGEQWEQGFRAELLSLEQERLEGRQREQGERLEALSTTFQASQAERAEQRRSLESSRQAISALRRDGERLREEIGAVGSLLADAAGEVALLQQKLNMVEAAPSPQAPKPPRQAAVAEE